MQTIYRLEDAAAAARTAVALGLFDGLHIGHAAVISLALAQAAQGLVPTVFTFRPEGWPDTTTQPEKHRGRRALMTNESKLALLEEWGVERVFCPDFSAFRQMTAGTFVDEVLVGGLHAGYVCCGEDFRFGRDAAAGVAELRALCAARGIEVETRGDLLWQGRRVSSTWIRGLLAEGEIEQAACLLGRAFGYTLPVVAGKRLGRTIGSPTINQQLPAGLAALRLGVYAAAVRVGGGWHTGVTNIGLRPTVEESLLVNSETYIHDFSGDLYGQPVEVRLLRLLRDEQKFASLELLRAQIRSDSETALPVAQEYLAKAGTEINFVEAKEKVC